MRDDFPSTMDAHRWDRHEFIANPIKAVHIPELRGNCCGGGRDLPNGPVHHNHPGGGRGCSCGGGSNCCCGVSNIVVDDATMQTFLYGNIEFDNYHVPTARCMPYITIPNEFTQWTPFSVVSEVFDGALAQITLANTPDTSRMPLGVYRNGLKQIEGGTRDYTIVGNVITFGIPLLVTDVVEVVYQFKGRA